MKVHGICSELLSKKKSYQVEKEYFERSRISLLASTNNADQKMDWSKETVLTTLDIGQIYKWKTFSEQQETEIVNMMNANI